MGGYEKYYRRIGKNLARYRKSRHLTQEGLALRAHVSRVHISHIEAENVDKAPSLDVLFRLCEVLGIEPVQLFEEEAQNAE